MPSAIAMSWARGAAAASVAVQGALPRSRAAAPSPAQHDPGPAVVVSISGEGRALARQRAAALPAPPRVNPPGSAQSGALETAAPPARSAGQAARDARSLGGNATVSGPGTGMLDGPSLLSALGRGATPLGQWNVGEPPRQAASRPGRRVEDGAERGRQEDTVVSRRVRGEIELGQWNAGSVSTTRQNRPGLVTEQAGASRRNLDTLSARLARGEPALEMPEGRAIVRPDGQGTAA